MLRGGQSDSGGTVVDSRRARLHCIEFLLREDAFHLVDRAVNNGQHVAYNITVTPETVACSVVDGGVVQILGQEVNKRCIVEAVNGLTCLGGTDTESH